MTEDKGIRDEKPKRHEIEQDDPTITRRVQPHGAQVIRGRDEGAEAELVRPGVRALLREFSHVAALNQRGE